VKIVIGGASGFLGSALARECSEDGHDVVGLVRKPSEATGFRAVLWDGKEMGQWASEVDGADGVVNLAGSSIFQKWSDDNRRIIRSSRLDSTKALRQAIEAARKPPRVFLTGSAVGYYGDTGDVETDESAPAGSGFLADLCQEWESAAKTEATRVVHLRTGIVLSMKGGSLPLMTKLAKAFLGGPVGDGRQYIPWIHLQDWIRLVRWCGIGDVSGAVNLSAPAPATNQEMMEAIRKAVGRPWSPPAPAAAVKLLGKLGGPEPSLALMSSRVVPKLALSRGFTFKWPTLEIAIDNLVA
jgi:uncharacterized protein (TIGR01777 family)